MAIPRKTQALQPSFKRYFFKEGGWQSVLKFAVSVSIVGYVSYKAFMAFKKQKLRGNFENGCKLYDSGVKGSEIGPMYYNEKRTEPEFAKCTVDTSKKLQFGESFIK